MTDTSAVGSGCLASYKHGRYTPLYQLGKGTYGKVLCCRDEYTGERVALKVTHNDAAYRCSALNEIRTLQQLSAHADVVHIRDSFEEQGHVCIVTELLQKNLYEALRARAFAPLHVRDIGKVAVHLLRAVAALHRIGYMHCDIKPENVMLRCAHVSAPTLPLAHMPLQLLHLGKHSGSHNSNNSNNIGGARVYNAYSGSGVAAAASTTAAAYYSDASLTMTTAAAAAGDGDAAQTTSGSSSSSKAATTDVDYDLVCLIDFGAVRALHENTYYDVQSLWYRAPEVLCKVPYTPNMDAWSIGCVLYELYTGKALFPGASAQDQLARIVQLVGSPSPATLCASSSTDIATHAAQLTAVLGQQQQQLQLLYYGGTANIASGGDAATAAAMTMSSRTAIEANLRSHICAQRAKALAQFQQQQQQDDATALSSACNSGSQTRSADVADGGSAAYATTHYGASVAYTRGTCKSSNNNNTHAIAAAPTTAAAPSLSHDVDARAEADLCNLIIALLHPDHHLRLGCAEALQHAFFATLHNSSHNNNNSSHYHHHNSSMGDVHAATTLPTLAALSAAAATTTASTTTAAAASASAARKFSYGHDDYYIHSMYSYNNNNNSNSSSNSTTHSAGTTLVAPHVPVQRCCASPTQQATTTRAHALTLQTSAHHTTAPATLHNLLCSPVTLNTLPYTSSYVLTAQEQPQPPPQQQQTATTTMHALHGSDAVTAYTQQQQRQQQQQQQCQNMSYTHGAQQGQGGYCARTTTTTAAVYNDACNDATRAPAMTLYDASAAATTSLHAQHHGHATSTNNNNSMSMSTSLCNNNNSTSALLNGDNSMFVQVGVSPTMLYHVPLSLAHVGVQAVYAADAQNNNNNNNNSSAGGYSYASTQHMYSLYSQDNNMNNSNNNSGIGGSRSNNNSMLDLMNSSLALHDGSDHYAARYKSSHGSTDSGIYSSDNSNSYVDAAAQQQQQQQQTMQGALHYVNYHPCMQLAASSQQQQQQQQLQASNSGYGFVSTTASATTTLYAHPTYNTVTGCYTTGFANTSALHCGVAPMLTQHTPMILTHT